jgi:hypothetical protein
MHFVTTINGGVKIIKDKIKKYIFKRKKKKIYIYIYNNKKKKFED